MRRYFPLCCALLACLFLWQCNDDSDHLDFVPDAGSAEPGSRLAVFDSYLYTTTSNGLREYNILDAGRPVFQVSWPWKFSPFLKIQDSVLLGYDQQAQESSDQSSFINLDVYSINDGILRYSTIMYAAKPLMAASDSAVYLMVLNGYNHRGLIVLDRHSWPSRTNTATSSAGLNFKSVSDMVYGDSTLFVADKDTLQMIDVSKPLVPILSGKIALPVTRLAYEAGTLYVYNGGMLSQYAYRRKQLALLSKIQL